MESEESTDNTSDFPPIMKKEKCFNCEENVESLQLEIHSLECKALKEILKCNICDKDFETSERFKSHIKHVHSSESSKNICEICHKSYSSSRGLKRHLSNVHGNDIIQKCDICNEEFATIQYLNRHKLCIHNPKHQCKLCSEHFPERNDKF